MSADDANAGVFNLQFKPNFWTIGLENAILEAKTICRTYTAYLYRMYKMKKLYLFLSLFFISSLCFASGISERKKTIEEEQTRIESRLLANLNVEKIKLKHSDKLLSDYWFIDIKLKNGGYIQSQYCTEEAFFSGNIPIWFIGSYSIWNDMYFKENNERTGNAFVNNRILSILFICGRIKVEIY